MVPLAAWEKPYDAHQFIAPASLDQIQQELPVEVIVRHAVDPPDPQILCILRRRPGNDIQIIPGHTAPVAACRMLNLPGPAAAGGWCRRVSVFHHCGRVAIGELVDWFREPSSPDFRECRASEGAYLGLVALCQARNRRQLVQEITRAGQNLPKHWNLLRCLWIYPSIPSAFVPDPSGHWPGTQVKREAPSGSFSPF